MKNLSYGPSKLLAPSYAGFSFGIVSFSKDVKVEVFNGFHSCREGLLAKIASNLGTINTDKTHMLLKWEAGNVGTLDENVLNENKLTNQRWIENSVKLLHLFENIAGWPITKMYKVKTDFDDVTKLYYFLSSRRWIKAPYLMSLYILLIRIGKFEYFDDFKTYDELVKIVTESSSYGGGGDEIYIKNTFKYWKTIVTNYAELFRKKKIEYYWSPERLSQESYVGYEGIAYLSSGDTRNSTLYKKFMELHKGGKKS